MPTPSPDLYQAIILDHHRSPRNNRALEDGACHAEGYNPLCGDQVTVWLRVADGIVQEATFQGQGCAISQASASLMTQALAGRTVAEAQALFERFQRVAQGKPEPQDGTALGKLVALSGVSAYPMRVKCATLAWHAMREALGGAALPAAADERTGGRADASRESSPSAAPPARLPAQ
ncbi:MAG: SUF system NifU family Fe-S cluster assembly protein [Gemmatimonadales bacterium]|nr:SUF system NifU family Fe-S cluster assembly protein [Gemmatimonadales bacterium]